MKDHRKKGHGTGYVIALGFLIVIAVGTLLLCMPFSSADGTFTNPIDALFTSVSATCVTGLTVTTTVTHWSVFGQVVILLLIQIGGLGFMTMAVLFSLILRRSVTPKERMIIAMSYNLNSYDRIIVLVRRILVGTLIIEGAGSVVLATQFIPEFGWSRGIWCSIFHSVSAFCNAGFDIIGDASLVPYQTNPVINLTLMALIIVGGIGFLVWSDAVNVIKRKNRFSVYSKLVLLITAILILSGAGLFALLEWNNPETIGNLSVGEKILSCFFHSVTLRTAGFATFDNGAMGDEAKLLSMLYMFVGGASGSTAGGVKVVTVGVLFWSVFSVAVGRKRAVVFGRHIPEDTCTRATAVITLQLLLILIGTLVINAAEPAGIGMIDILYEVVSAVSTVGLSAGITQGLGVLSKLVLIFLMYFGRVGILSVSCAIMVNLQKKDTAISYPDANLLIG